jgi:GNAT superfamily N-acetyltransferase
MTSASIVRVAQADDLDGLVALVLAARQEIGVHSAPDAPGRVARQTRAVITDPGVVALLATEPTDDDAVVGFSVIRPLRPSVWYDLPRLHVEALYVVPSARRRGHGRALIRGAMEWAQRIEAPEVIVLPISPARTTQRFLARLGFIPSLSHRVADTATLAETLAAEDVRRLDSPRQRSLAHVIATRRRLREDTGEIPPIPAAPSSPATTRRRTPTGASSPTPSAPPTKSPGNASPFTPTPAAPTARR